MAGQVHEGQRGTRRQMRLVLLPMEERDMKKLLSRLWQEEEGQDLTEYALLVVLIALAAVGAMKGLATAISTTFGSIATNLTGQT
jgi:pilus assembly protein Flp/PilA